MSNNWGHYFAQMGDHRASIVFDDGISKEMADLSGLYSIWIKMALKEWGNDGFPTNEEAERLNTIEGRLEAIVTRVDGMLLGRVTSNRERWIMALARTKDVCNEIRGLLENEHFELAAAQDSEKSIYWDDLYPDAESRLVMTDMQLMAQLRDNGDLADRPRDIDHWIGFDDRSAAEAFADWSRDNGYRDVKIEADEEVPARLWVRSIHTGTTEFYDITHHTLTQHRKAAELGGFYDGWGCISMTEDAKQ